MEKSAQLLEAFPPQINFSVEGADEKFEIFEVPVSFYFLFSFQTPVKLSFEDIAAKRQHKLVGLNNLSFGSLNKIKIKKYTNLV